MRSPGSISYRMRAGIIGSGIILIALSACNAAESAHEQTESPAGATTLAFTNVTLDAGLGDFKHETGALGDKWFPEAMGSGGGFIDYDGDGWEDVLLVQGGAWGAPEEQPPALWLYRNNGDGTFTQVTETAGLSGLKAYGLGIAVADYDNDGDEDIYFTTLTENKLLRNDGGRFTDVSERAGIAEESVWSSSAIFFDADKDGWLDLYSGNYVKWSPETDLFCSLDGDTKGYCTPETYEGVPSRFFHNNGDGTFSDWTAKAGFLPAPGKTLGVAELDFNRDGWPDLVVANDTQPNLLYENNGDGTFTEKGAVSSVAYDENGKARAGMGIDVGVVDSTGEETIFIGNFSKEMIGVYRHVSDGLFVDRGAISKIGRTSLLTLAFGMILLDADLDGDLDLYVANGHVQPEIEDVQEGISHAEPPHLFMNNGDGTFEDHAPHIGGPFSVAYVARAAAYADYDQDGDVDVLITENGGPAHLFRNDLRSAQASSSAPNMLRVRIAGLESNRDGIGSRVIAVVDGRRMERRVRSGSSYLASSEKTLTFGLGTAAHVDSLIVQWPSGTVDRFTDVEAGQTVLVTEGSSALRPVERGDAPLANR